MLRLCLSIWMQLMLIVWSIYVLSSVCDTFCTVHDHVQACGSFASFMDLWWGLWCSMCGSLKCCTDTFSPCLYVYLSLISDLAIHHEQSRWKSERWKKKCLNRQLRPLKHPLLCAHDSDGITHTTVTLKIVLKDSTGVCFQCVFE